MGKSKRFADSIEEAEENLKIDTPIIEKMYLNGDLDLMKDGDYFAINGQKYMIKRVDKE